MWCDDHMKDADGKADTTFTPRMTIHDVWKNVPFRILVMNSRRTPLYFISTCVLICAHRYTKCIGEPHWNDDRIWIHVGSSLRRISVAKSRIVLESCEGWSVPEYHTKQSPGTMILRKWWWKDVNLGVIEPARSEQAGALAPVRWKIVPLRFCVKYRKLNTVPFLNSYPILRLDEYVDSLGDELIFSTICAHREYWQVESTMQIATRQISNCIMACTDFLECHLDCATDPLNFTKEWM